MNANDSPARKGESAVERDRRRRRRLCSEIEIPELGAEAADEVFTETLIVGRAVLDDDDLVVEVFEPLLIGTRQ